VGRYGVETDHLAEGRGPGIGPGAGVDAHARRAGQGGNGGFEGFLDRAVAGLRLPAVEIAAVIGEDQLHIAHDQGKCYFRGSRLRRTSTSAICTALVAAPLRRLSATTHKFRPLATVGSRRTRPTKTSSRPSAASASGT